MNFILKSFLTASLFSLSFLFFAFPSSVQAASFAKKCPNLIECTKAVSSLTGDQYFFNKRDYEISVATTQNLELTSENATELLTRALYDEGYTRVPLSGEKQYAIMRIREANDTHLPEYRANSTTTPPMPETYDSVQLVYQVKNEESIEPICRHLHSLLPSTSRIIPNDLTNSIRVTGTSRDLKKWISTIREMDIKPSPQLKAKWAKEKAEKEKAAIKAQSSSLKK